jgi:hypothetical protein
MVDNIYPKNMRKTYILPAVHVAETYPSLVLMTSGGAVQNAGITTSSDGDNQVKARAPKF